MQKCIFLEIKSKVKNHHISEAGVSFEIQFGLWIKILAGEHILYIWQQTIALSSVYTSTFYCLIQLGDTHLGFQTLSDSAEQVKKPDEKCNIRSSFTPACLLPGIVNKTFKPAHVKIILMSQLMRLWYLSHRRTAKAQARLRIRAVSPEPLLFAHITNVWK